MSELKLFNSLTRQLETFTPVHDGEARVYTCGPTVYNYPHIGNMRAYVFADTLGRVLSYKGYKLTHVINITDVGHMAEDIAGNEIGEDKLLAQSKAEAIDPFEIARKYEANFHTDLARLNVIPATAYPRASETIDLMLKLIIDLISTNRAYVGADGCVYFSATTFEPYGEISGNRSLMVFISAAMLNCQLLL